MNVSRNWRLRAQRYRLEGTRCPTCGENCFPPRPVCPYCTATRASGVESLPVESLAVGGFALSVDYQSQPGVPVLSAA